MFAGSTLAEDPTKLCLFRGGSRTAATSKMEHFVIIVNGFHRLTIITKCSILDVAAVLGPSLISITLKGKRAGVSSFKYLILKFLKY